ncbi:MAG: Ribose ABC transport system, permease protein RbsC, partial [uncultured Solirubrobacteraceae bacterium]
ERHRTSAGRGRRRQHGSADDDDRLVRQAVVGRRAVGRPRVTADHRRPAAHRHHLPDAERPVPDRRQLREPDGPGRRVRDDRHGRRVRAAAGRDRPVDRLRQRRGGRHLRAPAAARRQRHRAGAGAAARAVGGRVDRGPARADHHEGGCSVVRGDAGRTAGVERRRAAAHRVVGHGRAAGRLHHRLRQRLPVGEHVVARRAGGGRGVRGDPGQRAAQASQGRPAERPDRHRRAAHRCARAGARDRRVRRQPGPRRPVRRGDGRRAARVLDLGDAAHEVRALRVRGRRQPGGRAARRHQRRPHQDRSVRDLVADGGARRDHPRLAAAVGRHERRRRLDPPVLDRGGGDRRHVAVRRPGQHQERAARCARDRVDRQRPGPARARVGREVRDHRRRAAAGGHGRLGLQAQPRIDGKSM